MGINVQNAMHHFKTDIMKIEGPIRDANNIIIGFLHNIEQSTKTWTEFNIAFTLFLKRKRFVKLTDVIKKWKL